MPKKRVADFVFVDGPACVLCGQKDRPVASAIPTEPGQQPGDGVCEVCAVRAYWDWRSEVGEIPPGLDPAKSKRISKVKVLVPRLRKNDGVELEPSFVDSYEFALSQSGKHWDLPSEDFDTDEVTTALKALDKENLVSWRWCIEPLYRGYTPRGGLVSIVLATAYAKKTNDSKQEFRPWPIDNHVDPGLAGLYYAMTEVWSLRLYKWAKVLKPKSSISVFVREAAKEYIRLKLSLSKPSDNVDTSMLDYYRKTMTADEKYICEICLGGEKVDGEIKEILPKTEVKSTKDKKLLMPKESEEAEDTEVSDENTSDIVDAFEKMEEDDDDPPEGFVRRGRGLSIED